MPKSTGDAVFGSTINQNGAIVVRAKAVGSDSALSQIVKLVEEAQMTKAPIQVSSKPPICRLTLALALTLTLTLTLTLILSLALSLSFGLTVSLTLTLP